MMCVIWNLALVQLEIVLVRCKIGVQLHRMHHSLRNHFGHTWWYSLVKRLKWKLGLLCLEIVLILMQDRCTVCMERTIWSEINLDTPNGTARCT